MTFLMLHHHRGCGGSSRFGQHGPSTALLFGLCYSLT
ncbi:hypothetical protein FQN60_011571 [Etheostoma spectabile]|uniref:Uncharacterized protein n=1 Tax=Etheostoma spectabile TaxID=54343 RepID=A0A5J5DLY0_9PERO|nr:hypothetical protein FQN60_011571 [Etheostoma spectabile]